MKEVSESRLELMARRAAIREGYKFIEVHLDPSQTSFEVEFRISGVYTVSWFQKRRVRQPIPAFEFTQKGGDLVFKLTEEGDWIAWMLDDNEPGLYSEKGYNRDFLASHYEENLFIIPDKTVEADVKKRAARIKEILKEKEEEKERAKRVAEEEAEAKRIADLERKTTLEEDAKARGRAKARTGQTAARPASPKAKELTPA